MISYSLWFSGLMLGLVELQPLGVMICRWMWPCGEQFMWNECCFRLNCYSIRLLLLEWSAPARASWNDVRSVKLQSRGVMVRWWMWPCGKQFMWSGCWFRLNCYSGGFLLEWSAPACAFWNDVRVGWIASSWGYDALADVALWWAIYV